MLKTVNDMYKEASSKNVMLLSNYPATFWTEYIANYNRYDKLFRRMFKSFIYFMQEEDETITEITNNFTEDVYNHLLVNSKKYEELYRIHVIDDNVYSLTENYDISETMSKTGSSSTDNVYGARSDSGSAVEGARNDSTTNDKGARKDTTDTVIGSQTNDTVEKVAPYDSSTFANNTEKVDNNGSRTDSVTFNEGTQSDSSSYSKGEQNNTSTFTKGEQKDSLTNKSDESYESRRHGNIGVQTVTDMLNKHKQFWTNWDFYRYVFNEISKELLLV